MSALQQRPSWTVPKDQYEPATRRPAPKWRNIEQLEELVRRGYANSCARQVNRAWRPGDDGTEFRRHFELRYDGNCETPIVFAMMATHHATAEPGRKIEVELFTRCRTCWTCKGSKAMYWARRAVNEFHVSPATYMVTLTLRPEMHYFYDAKMYSARPELHARLSEMEKAGETGLASATLFAARAQTIGHEVQKYLKRLRNGSKKLERKPCQFRYLQVAEAHKQGEKSPVAGRPHFHLLLHEVKEGTLIRETEYLRERGMCTRCNRWHDNDFELCDHAFVRTKWPHGYTKVVRCVDDKSAWYLCKYMSKAMEIRTRASEDYGDWNPGLAVTRDGVETRDESTSPVGKLTPRVPEEPKIDERSETKVKRYAS